MTRISLALLLILPALLAAQPFSWTTFTSTSNTVDLLEFEGDIWCASTGGVSRFDVGSGTFEVYTNTRGLAMNAATALGYDDRGWIWIGFQDGRITRLNPATGAVKQIIALEGEVFSMNRILTVGDDVFIAAENGIYRFTYNAIPDNYIVRESILVLGGFPNEIAVDDIAVASGYIYAGTASGLARADVNNDLLSAPAAWENFTTSNSDLPENVVRRLFRLENGDLMVGGQDIISRFDGAQFLDPFERNDAVEFVETLDGLFLATSNFFFQLASDGWHLVQPLIGSVTDAITIEIDGQVQIIAGVKDNASRAGGLAMVNLPESFEILRAPGVGGNSIEHVQLASDGSLVVLGGDQRGTLSRYDGSDWDVLSYTEENGLTFFNSTARNMAEDNHGGLWISSQGAGVLWISGTDTVQYNRTDSSGFDENGPRLIRAAAESQTYTITRVAEGLNGDIWISNRSDINGPGPALIRVSAEWIANGPSTEPWEYFYPQASGNANPTQIEELIVDPYDRVWMAAPSTINGPSYVLTSRGAVADSSDDRWFTYSPTALEDAATCFPEIFGGVLSWAIDAQNYLWVGTPNGAYYVQGGLPFTVSNSMRFICVFDIPIGTRVNDIYVDSQDNKWFATDEGIAVLDPNFTWVHIFQDATSIDNASQLTSNSVTSITSDPETGVFWIGTQDGLSRLQTPYLSRDTSLDEVWPYPNPFRADGTQRMFLDTDRLGGRFDEARIFTITGRLVNTLTWSEMISNGWDGRNEDGDLVAGGVYLVVTSAASGNSATGKVAVLGR